MEDDRSNEAIQILETVRDRLNSQFGPHDRDAIDGQEMLAHAYMAVGRAAEAISILNDVVKRRTATLGPDAQDTLYSRFHFARSLAVPVTARSRRGHTHA